LEALGEGGEGVDVVSGHYHPSQEGKEGQLIQMTVED
jgi:hypothetical protein